METAHVKDDYAVNGKRNQAPSRVEAVFPFAGGECVPATGDACPNGERDVGRESGRAGMQGFARRVRSSLRQDWLSRCTDSGVTAVLISFMRR